MTSRVLVALLVLCSACGGRTSRQAPEPYWPAEGCPPSHEMRGGRCQVKEIFVPGGTFTMGRGYCDKAGALEEPPSWDCPLLDAPHPVTVKPFWVDATVYVMSDTQLYEDESCPSRRIECAKPGAYFPVPSYNGGYPPDPVDPTGSDYACWQLGKRPLDEAEWEYVATGGGTRTYPWGEEEPTCDHANIGGGCAPYNAPFDEESLIASYPPSAEGIYDLIGNIGEFVVPAPYAHSETYTAVPIYFPDCNNPDCDPIPDVQVYRGGQRNDSPERFKAPFRAAAWSSVNKIGGYAFRCARSAE